MSLKRKSENQKILNTLGLVAHANKHAEAHADAHAWNTARNKIPLT